MMNDDVIRFFFTHTKTSLNKYTKGIFYILCAIFSYVLKKSLSIFLTLTHYIRTNEARYHILLHKYIPNYISLIFKKQNLNVLEEFEATSLIYRKK